VGVLLRVLFFIRAKPGQRFQAIKGALGLDKDGTRAALDALVEGGTILREGELRGTRDRPASG
jgi:DNA-binding MarR family transcriptional regulator